MKTVVVVVIYNRKENLLRWLDVWSKIKPSPDVELRIIHNLHPEEPTDNFRRLVTNAGITYIPRKNVGMDIGAFQDVCLRRLNGFKHDFDFIIWMTDDTFPMRNTFVAEFLKPFLADPATGVSCLEISPQVKKHVRTTGFCMRANILGNLHFDANPVITKDDCYKFEHRGNSLYNQLEKMKLKSVQLSPVPVSPVWDSGGGGIKWPDRENEFLAYWKIDIPPAKVIVIAPAFNRYPVIVASMIAQTYTNWELHLVHDGPAPHDFPRFNDERIIFTETTHRKKEYGHPIRVEWLQKIRAGHIQGKYVVVSNDDNYHAPHFIEKLVRPLEKDSNLVGSYCSMMVHNYQGGEGYDLIKPMVDGHIDDGYGIIHTKPECGYIDCAAVMIRANLAGESGWPSMRHSSDWDYLNNIAIKNGGWNKFKSEFGALLVHN